MQYIGEMDSIRIKIDKNSNISVNNLSIRKLWEAMSSKGRSDPFSYAKLTLGEVNFKNWGNYGVLEKNG